MPSTRRGVPRGSRAAPDDVEEAPPLYDGSRTCAVCGMPLSRYNAGPHCWRHSDAVPWRGPAAPPAPKAR